MLSITAAANWKLFAFYGKYIRNRPSKKCLLPSTAGELCPVRLCLFCMILPGAPICIVLGGSWSDLGCSATLECSAFLLPRLSPLFHAIHWRPFLSFGFLCCFAANKSRKEKTMPAPTKKRCTSCGKEKSLSDFYHNVTKSDRHNSIWKDCQKLSNATNKARKNLPNF